MSDGITEIAVESNQANLAPQGSFGPKVRVGS